MGKMQKLFAHPKTIADIQAALPKHMTPDRQLKVALATIMKTPAIAECSIESVISCLIDCSSMGLEPDGRRAHLIPYGNKCTLIIDYKGLVDLVYRSDRVHFIEAFAVFEKDREFELVYGFEPSITHKPAIIGDKGEFIGAYAVAHIKGMPRPKF